MRSKSCDYLRSIMAALERKTASKGGYDYEFVSPPPKSLECPVCLLTLRDPHVISCCGNEFCQVCIERVQRDGKPCPLCNEPKFTTFLHKKLVREVNALAVRCPQKELGCDWEGELGQLQNHLSPGAGVVTSKGCGFIIVDCAYQCGAQLQRQLLQEHEMEICPKRPIEIQVASLMRKFDTVTAQFKTVSTENQQLRQEVEKMQKIHKDELNQMKQELMEVKKRNAHLQRECDELKRAVRADFHKKFNDLEKKCVSLALQTHTVPLPVPPFYFSVANVDHFQSNDLAYRSEPFYSHPGGYKISVSVYPNGYGDSYGMYMGVYVIILRGEFDDQLCWPFDGRITVQAYNRTTKQWSNEHTIILERVTRCTDVLAHGCWGFSNYLRLSDLIADYVWGTNIIRFRIVRVRISNS